MARRTRWIDSFIDVNIANAAQDQTSMFAAFALGTFYGSTVVRTIASLWLASSDVAGAWGYGKLDIGFGVISQESVGAVVFPDPGVPGDFPVRGWTFRERCGVFQNGANTDIFTRCVFDIASQRRVETGEYYMVTNWITVLGTNFGAKVMGSVRTLLLLP